MSLLALTSILLFFSMAFTTINARIVLPPPVVDTDGNPVQFGSGYHLVPFWVDTGGGLALGPNSNHDKTCPLSVVQLSLNAKKGLPIHFYVPVAPAEINSNYVLTSIDLILQFNSSSICGKNPTWKLDEFDESVGKYFISTTNAVTRSMKLEFKIERLGSSSSVNRYKLSHCPTVCSIVCHSFARTLGCTGMLRMEFGVWL
ncbi:hypothetical protein Sjap_025623 [Stephania japonica]|uniref:Uncharacterized protein n=1 Tax=Stephania japonica TaxID=461633 RepID=A0AAP0HHQ1_9MAGN